MKRPMHLKNAIINLFAFILLSSGFYACSSGDCPDPVDTSKIDLEVEVTRLEEAMNQLQSKADIQKLLDTHRDFAQRYMDVGRLPDSIVVDQIHRLLEEPYFDTLYQDVQRKFGDFSEVEQAFVDAFKHIKYYYPDFKAPKIYTVVTGLGDFFGQGRELFISEDILVISLDFFIGADAKVVPTRIPNYIRRRYHPGSIVSICLRMMSSKYIKEDFEDKTLIADMIFYGKANHFVETMIPCLPDSILYGYSSAELARIEPEANRNYIWNYLIEQELLFSTNRTEKREYIEESPYNPAYKLKDIRPPGRIGRWYGTRIIHTYLEKNSELSFQELMEQSNARALFIASGYQGD